eukprot:c5235_g1_i1 orf=2-229(-)
MKRYHFGEFQFVLSTKRRNIRVRGFAINLLKQTIRRKRNKITSNKTKSDEKIYTCRDQSVATVLKNSSVGVCSHPN